MKTVKIIYPDGSSMTMERAKEVIVTESIIDTIRIIAEYGVNYSVCTNFNFPLDDLIEQRKFINEIITRLKAGFKVSIEYSVV
jgi:hypothetical protein